MATTWYFRDINATTGPTATASTDTDSFSSTPADKNTPKDMSPISGAAQTSVAGVYNTASTPLYTMVRIFVGPALQAQTLTGAQANYQVGLAIQESAAQMNLYDRCFVYVWRSGSGNVKTIIVPTSGATEHGTAETGTVITATGAAGNFSILAGDRIVVEAWWDIRNTKATNYTATYYYDGTTDVVDGTATSDARGFFTCPQTLNAFFSQNIQESENIFDPIVTATFTAGGIPNIQTVQEFLRIFDVVTSFSTFNRQIQDSLKLEVVFSKLSHFIKQFNEYETIGDIPSTSWSTSRTVNEWLRIFEATITSAIYQRVVNEWMVSFDAVTLRSVFSRELREYTTLYDAITTQRILSPKTINEYIIMQDSQVVKLLTSLRQTQENLNIFDSVTTVGALNIQTTQEFIEVFDSISSRTMMVRSIQDYQSLFDSATQISSLTKIQTVNEWTTLFDAIITAPRYIRVSTEWLNIFESQTRLVIFNRQIVEYTTIFDAITATTEELSNLILYLIKCVEVSG